MLKIVKMAIFFYHDLKAIKKKKNKGRYVCKTEIYGTIIHLNKKWKVALGRLNLTIKSLK